MEKTGLNLCYLHLKGALTQTHITTVALANEVDCTVFWIEDQMSF